MKKRIAVIGSGFSGIAAAAYTARAGNEVHVFEKHDQPGGRARQLKTEKGYVFDMGPSWYWMPDVIENFFRDMGCEPADFFELVPLNPQFEMVFSDGKIEVPESYDELKNLFEGLEPGAGKKLDKFMKAAQFKYKIGMQELINKPCFSWSEFIVPKTVFNAFKFNLFTNFRTYVRRYFFHPKLQALMEFPVIFLGASPKKIPALYSLMNYGGYALGTWYPMGGFYQLVTSMKKAAENQGAKFHFNKTVEKINAADGRCYSLVINGQELEFDAIIASSDYHHTETLLPKNLRSYSEGYWQSRTFAPSCLIFYLGFKERIPNLKHHTLFFEHDLDAHIDSIYTKKEWPENPLFYACCTSKTDSGTAPENGENLFLLLPLTIGINDDEEIRERYLQKMISRLEAHTGAVSLREKIDYKKSYCVSDFINDYNAYKGNAYGLANTLRQTAVYKPKIRSKKIKNLFFTGQLTVPGPGVPPALISGKIAANEVNNLKIPAYEKTF